MNKLWIFVNNNKSILVYKLGQMFHKTDRDVITGEPGCGFYGNSVLFT